MMLKIQASERMKVGKRVFHLDVVIKTVGFWLLFTRRK